MSDDIDYGPLAGLIGTWKGDQGIDVAPEPDGTEESPYHETLVFEGIGEVTNAESQTLAAVRYHQVVRRKSDDEVFHDQVGYWMWDAAERTVMQSLLIPRAVGLIAGGGFGGPADARGPVTLEVSARLGDERWGIVQSPFMGEKARTTEFRHTLTIDGDRLHYAETTTVGIYGKTFEHTDENRLVRSG
ncbi:MAG: heme-binding beta-barrel domain-containing protein [Planctomycetota bacterium]